MMNTFPNNFQQACLNVDRQLSKTRMCFLLSHNSIKEWTRAQRIPHLEDNTCQCQKYIPTDDALL